MNREKPNSWLSVQREIRRRIQAREWAPGEYIPHEAELAAEVGCARSTMNRALRSLAETGLIERKRKAGTRVAVNPVRQVRFEIPIIREEIESKGSSFHYLLLAREVCTPPTDVRARLQTGSSADHLHVETLYTANRSPYVYEDRWINLNAAPSARNEHFQDLSPNEWLVQKVPFDGGDFTFSALTAGSRLAEMLACAKGDGLFALDRTTRVSDQVITSVRLVFHKGYQLHTRI